MAVDTALATFEASVYLGPLPPPENLERYEAMLPGATDRSFAVVEREQSGRFRLQNRVITTERLRISASFVLGGMLIGVAAYAVSLGHPGYAIPFGIAGFGVAFLRTITAALQRSRRPPPEGGVDE